MGELTIFKSNAQLPTHFSEDDFGITKDMSAGMSNLPPMIKISNKCIFELHQNGEVTPMGAAFKAIIIGSSPPKLPGKKYYATKYTGKEGAGVAPDCASVNGVTPDSSIENPICKSCSICPLNVYGSKVNDLGNKTTACADTKRLVIYIPSKDIDAPKFFRLDLPTMSVKVATHYSTLLALHGYPVEGVYTNFSFDPKVKYPKLMFDAIQVLNAEQFEVIRQERKDPEIKRILTMEVANLDLTKSDQDAPVNEPSPTDELVEPVVAKKTRVSRKKQAVVEEADTSELQIKSDKEPTATTDLATTLDGMIEAMED